MKAHHDDAFWGNDIVLLYRVCMFECISPQTFEKKSPFFLHIILEYNLGKILKKIISFHFMRLEIQIYLWKQI
jgi:hypothetical protein